MSVHPRVCGEQILVIRSPNGPVGSSPRVRGTVHGVDPRLPENRFIPACAGNRPKGRLISDGVPVHPRVCGEQASGDDARHDAIGSSPRVRGTVAGDIYILHRQRFIPACAGNRSVRLAMMPRPPVHPRVCGEQFQPRPNPSVSSGSSPRVRGTVRACRRSAV